MAINISSIQNQERNQGGHIIMSKNKKLLFVCVVLFGVFCYVGEASPETDQAVGGSAQVSLDFQVQVPTILWLRVGSLGATVDQITFTVNDVPGTGAIAQNEAAVTVRAAGFVGNGSTMTLAANSSTAMTDGTDTIPFDEISWTATGDFSNGTFNNGAAQQIDQFSGSGDRNGTYTFSYDNDTYYPAANYDGTVTYTLSSP
jgi:hypothetical protein